MFRSHYKVVSEYRQFHAKLVVKRDLRFFGCSVYVTNCTTHEFWVLIERIRL